MKINNLILISLLIGSSFKMSANELKIKDFLKMVREKSETILIAQKNIGLLNFRKNEGEQIHGTQLFANTLMSIDKKETMNTQTQGDRTDYNLYSAGLMKQSSFGLKTKLSYNLSHTDIHNASSNFLPLRNFHDSQIALEFNQPLLKNFLGAETNALKNLAAHDLNTKLIAENIKIKTILISAENLYWNLAGLKKLQLILKESLSRAQKIKAWANERFANGLGDKSDVLQADANVKFREFELKSTELDIEVLEKKMNKLINSNNEKFDYLLSDLNEAGKLILPQRNGNRLDTQLAFEIELLKKENAELNYEKNRSSLDLYGTLALNGKDANRNNALEESTKTEKSSMAIGLKWVIPLDFITSSEVKKSYQLESMQAELVTKQKEFDENAEWSELNKKFLNAKEKYDLSLKITEAQKTKAIYERERLKKGRTVTFQVLNFEQDLAQSELLKVKNEIELYSLYAEAKLYNQGDL